jgi:hypothetical protein
MSNILEGKKTRAFIKIYKTIDVNSNPPVQFKIQEMCYDAGLGETPFLGYSILFIGEKKSDPYTMEEFFDFVRKLEQEKSEDEYDLEIDDKEDESDSSDQDTLQIRTVPLSQILKKKPVSEETSSLIKDANVKNIKKLLDFIRDVYLDMVDLGIEQEYYYLDIHEDNIMVSSGGDYRLVDF